MAKVIHSMIRVLDLDRSLKFYRDVLGFEETSRLQVSGPESERLLEIEGGAVHAVYLHRDGTTMELLHYPQAGHQGARRIARWDGTS